MFTWLLLLVPVSVALAAVTTPTSLWTFTVATAAVVPLAESIRRATEHLARRAGPAIGGLLNVSFGNTAELVLALFVLASGRPDVVKAQLTGSIIGNSLLGLGLAIVVGTHDHLSARRQDIGRGGRAPGSGRPPRGIGARDDNQRQTSMKKTFTVGDHVTWNSEAGHVRGTIIKVHTKNVNYKEYTHHASKDEPQYEIKSGTTDHIAMHKGSALKRSK